MLLCLFIELTIGCCLLEDFVKDFKTCTFDWVMWCEAEIWKIGTTWFILTSTYFLPNSLFVFEVMYEAIVLLRCSSLQRLLRLFFLFFFFFFIDFLFHCKEGAVFAEAVSFYCVSIKIITQLQNNVFKVVFFIYRLWVICKAELRLWFLVDALIIIVIIFIRSCLVRDTIESLFAICCPCSNNSWSQTCTNIDHI